MKSPLQKAALLLPQRLAQQGAELTASEQTLAQTLGSDYPHALLESATALAARTGTSASTVVRLFAKLGYASYAEAQREARGEVTALLQTAAQRAPVLLGAQRSLSECVTMHCCTTSTTSNPRAKGWTWRPSRPWPGSSRRTRAGCSCWPSSTARRSPPGWPCT